MIAWIACIIGAYVVGSIPFGVLIAQSQGVDIRARGSRNIGATNVGRVLGRPFGIACFVLDVLKGAAPVAIVGLIMTTFGHSPLDIASTALWMWMLVAIAAVIGHMYSVFLGFAGGKGVATGFGAMLAMYTVLTIPTLVALLVWLVVVRVTRYVSLASILAAVALPIACIIRIGVAGHANWSLIEMMIHAHPPIVVTALLAALVVYKHRANIARLRAGTEGKLGAPVETATPTTRR